MNRFPCRCSHCGGRRTLRMRPEDYQPSRVPRCRSCIHYKRQGKPQQWRVDWYRRDREHKGTLCRYSAGCAYTWDGPHRRGSRLCVHNPRFNENLKEDLGVDNAAVA